MRSITKSRTTRKHSSRMRTAHLPTIRFLVLSGAGVGIPGPMLGVGTPGHTRPSPLGYSPPPLFRHTHPWTYPHPLGYPPGTYPPSC